VSSEGVVVHSRNSTHLQVSLAMIKGEKDIKLSINYFSGEVVNDIGNGHKHIRKHIFFGKRDIELAFQISDELNIAKRIENA
jgi:hypothetical protein